MVTKSKIIEKDNYRPKWFLKDTIGNEYLVKQYSINSSETEASFKLDRVANLFNKLDFETFCINNNLPIASEMNLIFFDKYIKDLILVKKIVNIPRKIWNIRKMLDYVYSAIIIINSEVVGRVNCDVLTKSEIENDWDDLLSKNMNLYISMVDIRPEFQNMGLCKPLLSYTISNLRLLGHEQLFIYNASRTQKGVPACICYYKAGVENKYRMRAKKSSKVSVMNENDCLMDTKLSGFKINNTYYYMSDNISKRAIKKIKKSLKL